MDIPKDIRNRIARDFGVSTNEACEQLTTYLGRQEREPVRTARCAIYLAQGSMQELARILDEALSDYRNVIFWAEYNRGEETPVRDFGVPFDETA